MKQFPGYHNLPGLINSFPEDHQQPYISIMQAHKDVQGWLGYKVKSVYAMSSGDVIKTFITAWWPSDMVFINTVMAIKITL